MSISTNALAVRDGHANSHAKKGWELFTDAAIRALAQQRSGLIFLLWGNSAQEKIKQVATTLHVNIFFYWCVSLPFSIFLTTLFSFMDPVIHRQSINVLQEVSYVVKLIVYDSKLQFDVAKHNILPMHNIICIYLYHNIKNAYGIFTTISKWI